MAAGVKYPGFMWLKPYGIEILSNIGSGAYVTNILWTDNWKCVKIIFVQNNILMMQPGHNLHLLWQINCHGRWRVVTWVDYSFFCKNNKYLNKI